MFSVCYYVFIMFICSYVFIMFYALMFLFFLFLFFLRFCFFDARINPFTHHFHQNNTDVILGSLLTLNTGKSLLF